MSARAGLPRPEDFFEAWLRERADPVRDEARPANDRPLKAENARPYRLVWLSWCRWLLEHDERGKPRAAHWSAAKARHLQQFLAAGPSPKSTRRGRAAPISEITSRRYWRILQRIYQHALDKHLVKHNPADASLIEAPPQEAGDSEILPAPVWDVLRTLTWPVAQWTDLRDLAIWGLLVELALTPQEIIQMTVPTGRSLGNLGSLRTHVDGRLTVAIELPEARVHQNRELTPSAQLGEALLTWEAQRRTLTARAGAEDRLFLSMQGGPMSHRNLFHLVAGKIAAAYELAHMGKQLPGHIGPLALRTTWLYHHLRAGADPAQLSRDAGLKDAKSLRRLSARLHNDAGATGAARARTPGPRAKHTKRPS
jgi:site-specific recombinase XerD